MDIVWYLLGKKAGSLKLPVIPPDAGVLSSIVIGNPPDKTTYIEGEPLDLTGVQILGNFSNGYQYDVTNGCTFIANDPVTYYDTKITAKYVYIDTEKTVDIGITVVGKPQKAPASTRALYHLDSNLKNSVNDVSGTGTYVQSAGKFDKGARGVGSSYATFTDIVIPFNEMYGGTYTIEFWAYRNGGSAMLNVPAYVYLRTATNNSTALFSNNNSRSVASYGLEIGGSLCSTGSSYKGTINKVWSPGTFSQASWHHYAVVIDHGNYTTFLDGHKSVYGKFNEINNSEVRIECFRFESNSSIDWMYDEILFCEGAKYSDDFEPPHGPYYLAQGGE